MTSRERLRTIIAGGTPDRCGFWMGNPHGDSWPIIFEHFGTQDPQEIHRLLGDDFAWFVPWDAYRHPEGKPVFDFSIRMSPGGTSPFADCEDVREVEAYPWPNPEYLHFDSTLDRLRAAGDVYRAGGMWTPFFHEVAGLFGMEEYFIKMHTHPEVVDAVTNHVCAFYYEANERFFAQTGDLLDGYFFGNDFGTQLDLLVSPELFDRFIMPWFRKFTDQGHRHGYQVILHSCGSIHKVIDRLIDAGVNALHPLQALAAHMDADTLARDFKGRIAFIGGVDTQDLLIHGTPAQIKADVRRIKALLGPNLIISPSHEAILPNVPVENIIAMSEAARE